jgi:hypothetical protein
VIADPRRILNADETPQPMDMAQKGRKAKVAKRQGSAVRNSDTENKETLTVNMCWDLSGYNYGVQLVSKRKTLSNDMVIEAPSGARQFDDTVDLVHMQTRSCLISRTKEGIQTEESFIQYLKALDSWITQRSEAEVAAGGEAIERPVVLMLDNHASRYGDDVLAAAEGACPALGIRLFTEEPATSGFLQALDQYNSKFHRGFNKAKEAFKQAYKARHGSRPAHIGLKEFLSILGGDASLGLPGVWFSWADPFDIVTAFRKVGISGNVLCPDNIDRTEFIDQAAAERAVSAAPSSSPIASIAEAARTPEGVRTGSLAAMQAKVEALKVLAQKYKEKSEAAFDPVEAGMLRPVSAVDGAAPSRVPDDEAEEEDGAPARKRSRLSDMHGSFTLREMRAMKERRKEAVEGAAQEKAQRKQAAADKKAQDEAEAAGRIQAFEQCERECACGAPPCACPFAKWKRCPTCGPKPGLCKARACVAARKSAGSSDITE